MEKIHKVAKAYYKAASETTKVEAQSLFNNMDTDGDGEVSFSEFKNYLKGGDQDQMKKHFDLVDIDKSGELDFWEAVTFYYLLTVGVVQCDKCEAVLVKKYFTCITCYNDTNTNGSYDLCKHCFIYTDRNHQHDNFSNIKTLLKYNPPQHRSKQAVAADIGQSMIEIVANEVEESMVGIAAEIGVTLVEAAAEVDVSAVVEAAAEAGVSLIEAAAEVGVSVVSEVAAEVGGSLVEAAVEVGVTIVLAAACSVM